jgi:hypothetical protein
MAVLHGQGHMNMNTDMGNDRDKVMDRGTGMDTDIDTVMDNDMETDMGTSMDMGTRWPVRHLPVKKKYFFVRFSIWAPIQAQ